MVKYSRDNKVKFFEKKHTYKLNKDVLTSSTSFLKPYFQPFDAKKIAKKLAGFWANKQKKHGVRWFLKDWKEAAEHGTFCHMLLEQYTLGNISKEDIRRLLNETKEV